MNISDIVKALMDSGATPEMTLAAIKACEQSSEQEKLRKREAARIRKQKSRANVTDVTVTSVTSRDKRDIVGHGVTSVTECDTSDKSASPPYPPPNGFPDPSLTPPYNPPQPKDNRRGKRLLTVLGDDLSLPSDYLFEATALGFTLESSKEVWTEFVDYWRGVPGQKGVKLDWLGTWRNALKGIYAGREKGRVRKLTASEQLRKEQAERDERFRKEFGDESESEAV